MGLFNLNKTTTTPKLTAGEAKNGSGSSCIPPDKKDPVIDHNHKYEPTIIDNIRRYRLQMMVHSVIYYPNRRKTPSFSYVDIRCI